MASKLDLAEEIVAEFILAQSTGLQFRAAGSSSPFPPMIGTGDGTHFAATDRLLACVSEYADALRSNEASVRHGFPDDEFETIVQRAFAQALQSAVTVGGAFDAFKVAQSVDETVQEEVQRQRRNLRIFLGCSLIRETRAYPITVGPVVFQTREEWLREREQSREVSTATARRLRKAWSGIRIRKRKRTFEVHNEQSILDAIGNHEIVCTITTNGLTQKAAKGKAIQCARLAITAVTLMWPHPQSAAQWMHLNYDGGRYLQRYAVLSHGSRFISGGSSVSQLPGGKYAEPTIVQTLRQFQPIFDVLGEALAAYLDVDQVRLKPDVKNALFLALWWYHEGCREKSDHMAVVAFAASLDALAAGGKAKGIKELISTRLGIAPSQTLMTDGRTANEVVNRIYDAARSRFIHGSSVDYREDWSRLRTTAETLGRLALERVCDWVHRHPAVSDPSAMRAP